MFVFFISFITMFVTLRLIKNHSPYKILSLFILYPSYYLTYFFSGFRQGLVISIFIGIGIDMLYKRKYLRYCLLILLLSLIYTSAILLLIIPFILKFKNIGFGKSILFVIIGILFVYFFGMWNHLYSSLLSGISVIDFKVSVFGLLNRFIMFFVIYVLYNKSLECSCIDIKNWIM